MAKRQKSKRRDWSVAEEKNLKSSAGKKDVAVIARALKRSEAAVRFKAHTLGLSLARK